MNKALMALIALAGVLALASTGCALDTNGLPLFSCGSFTSLHVTAAASGFTTYQYTAECVGPFGQRDNIAVYATYEPAHLGLPGKAYEQIEDTTIGPGSRVEFWSTCYHDDPWYTGKSCTMVQSHGDTVLTDFIKQSNLQYPVSSAVLTPEERQQLRAAKDAWKTQPCPPKDMFAIVASPGGNATYQGDIPVHITPGAQWCTMPHVYDLAWMRNTTPGAAHPTWEYVYPYPQINETNQPSGFSINKVLFYQIGTGEWRVQARVAGQNGAPWSAWSYFRVQ